MTTNRWKPDTCGCVIEYEFDADLPDDQRIISSKNIEKGCIAHPIEEKVAHYAKVLGENRGKNRAMKKLLDSLPEEHAKLNENGEREDFLKRPSFSFDVERKLVLKLDPSHPKSQKLEDDVKADFPDVKIE